MDSLRQLIYKKCSPKVNTMMMNENVRKNLDSPPSQTTICELESQKRSLQKTFSRSNYIFELDVQIVGGAAKTVSVYLFYFN